MMKNKEYSFINIVGLGIGLTCAILIALWIQDELNYDTFHKNKNELYRVVRTNTQQSWFTYHVPGSLAEALKGDFPEIVNATAFCPFPDAKISTGLTAFYSDLKYVDPGFFDMFTFKLLGGEVFTEASPSHSIVITETLARKLFGASDPVGKTVIFNDQEEFQITGVLENVPRNSHLAFDCLIPMEMAPKSARIWGNNWPSVYVQLQPGTLSQTVNQKIARVIQLHKAQSEDLVQLQPLLDYHLHNLAEKSRVTVLYVFAALAVVVLFTACINFINLYTAYSERRAREIGVKKVLGSSRGQLVRQFLSESLLYAFLALALSILIVKLLLPQFNSLTQKNLSLIFDTQTFLVLFATCLLTGLVSGIYPAVVLSFQKPASVLKSVSHKSFRNSALRKILIVAQFVFSIFLIIAVLVITNQLKFIQNKNLGFDKEHVLVVKMRGEINEHAEALKNELLKNPDIERIAVSENPLEQWKSDGLVQCGNSGYVNAGFNWVDSDIQKTLGLEMIEGRFFSTDFQSDLKSGVVINEAAAERLGIDGPAVGKTITISRSSNSQDVYRIIGVIRDYHTESLHQSVRPFVLMHSPAGFFMYVRVSPEHMARTIGFIEAQVKAMIPDEPFAYRFLDEDINALYQSEQVLRRLVSYATFLAIMISSLGLLGLVAFMTAQRTREIGIRKVLGASSAGIVSMLTSDMLQWVILANGIGWPAAWFVMRQWLSNFAYRIDLTIWPFLIAGVSVLFIALVTVGFQTIQAALANPIKALRYE